MNFIEMKLMISGRVQGVGFRHFTRVNADELGLKGWVRNLDTGDVETLLQGPENSVHEMLQRLEKGPRAARVDQIKVVEENGNPSERELVFSVVR